MSHAFELGRSTRQGPVSPVHPSTPSKLTSTQSPLQFHRQSRLMQQMTSYVSRMRAMPQATTHATAMPCRLRLEICPSSWISCSSPRRQTWPSGKRRRRRRWPASPRRPSMRFVCPRARVPPPLPRPEACCSSQTPFIPGTTLRHGSAVPAPIPRLLLIPWSLVGASPAGCNLVPSSRHNQQ